MQKLLLGLILICAISGCATQKKYQSILNTWLGASENQLISSWGPPDNVYESDSSKFLTYTTSRNVVLGQTNASYTTTVIGNTAYTAGSGGSPGRNYNMSCRTTFEIRAGKIFRWSYKGNDCTAI